jgi:predicted PurR-regulated permease PerM
VKEDFSMQGLIKIVLLLLIVLLFQATAGIWQGLFSRLFNVFKPFLYGFVIAYILRRAFTRLEKAGVPRKISIPVVYVIIIALLLLLISTLFPIVLNRTSSLIESMINGINWVTVHIQTLTSGDMPPWIVGLVDAGVSALSDFRSLIPNLTGSLPDFVNATISTLTMIIFSIVISIFMSFGWEKIRYYIVYLSLRVGRRFNTAVFAIDHEIDDYLKSMLTLMLKGILALTASFLLVATSGIARICAALRRMHVPSVLVTLLLLTYRYITLLSEEVSVMSNAYHLRAPRQKGIEYSAWGSFLG